MALGRDNLDIWDHWTNYLFRDWPRGRVTVWMPFAARRLVVPMAKY